VDLTFVFDIQPGLSMDVSIIEYKRLLKRWWLRRLKGFKD